MPLTMSIVRRLKINTQNVSDRNPAYGQPTCLKQELYTSVIGVVDFLLLYVKS